MKTGITPGQRAAVRTVAIFAVLLWLCLPASTVVWIFTGDRRWVTAGLIAFATGWAVAWALHEAGRSFRAAAKSEHHADRAEASALSAEAAVARMEKRQ